MESRKNSDRQIRRANCFSAGGRMKTRSPSVIVIGGGFGGISAARTLQDASFQVVVLESRDRIGGRVHTDYSFGFPVDLGASWLHGVCKENPLAPVIGRLGLPLYRTSGDNSVLYDHDLESYALFDMDGNQVPQELVTEVGVTFEQILEEINKVRDEQEADMSISQAFSIVFSRKPELRLEGLAHNVLQWYLCRMEGWFAADADTISAKCWDQEELLPGGHGLMVRGYRPVINTLSKGIDIRLGHRVTKIVRRYNGVKVTTENGQTFVADAAVIAVPLGVLKSGTITFEPKLPEWKQEAINDLGVGIENKIVLHFEKVFWPKVEFLGVVAETSYGCSYFLNLHKATGHPVLVYMPAGQLAKDIEKMSDEAAANFAVLQLQRILPDALPPVQYLVSRWGSDVNSLGSYSYDIVGKPHDLYERLRVPVDNLFFAGEATSSSFPGSVHGAYSTGLMAGEDCRMRVLEILRSKWVAMAASIWIQCTSGASYTFGIYSAALKSTQSYDQSTLDTVSVFKDIGANAGVFSGLLYTYVTSNRRRGRGGNGGPWVVLAIGAIQCFAGYFLMWASVTGLIRKPPVPLMCLFMFIASQSQTFFNTANVVSAVENFADYGGTAVGIMKGFLGLSGAILIQLYETLCGGDPASFILLLAVTPTVLSLLAMPLVRIYETSTADDKKHLNGLSAVSLIIAAYLMILIIVKNTFGLSSVANVVTLVCLVLLLALPLLIATRARRDRMEKTALPDKSPLITSPKAATSVNQSSVGDSQAEAGLSENLNLLQAMKSLSFWLLFLAMICGMGSGLSTINNIRQIGESLRYSSVEINSLVSLWSIWNFLGRFGAGYASDAMLHKKGWPRPWLMAATLGTMTIGHLIIASGFQGNLYVGSVIVGVCYGSQWSLMPTITSELFGVRHMGTIFNTISIASPIGSYVFSVRLIGYIYDKTASGVGNKCFGSHCFRLSFVIMASVAFFGFLVAIVLFFRTKTLYRQILVKRLHRR